MNPSCTFLVIENRTQLELFFDSILNLLEMSTADGAILGFQKKLTETDANNYKSDLMDQIQGGTLKLLIAHTDSNEVVLNCFLKGSLQDTTRHIFDLQKGFIHPDLRGTGLLPKAMYFIAKTAKDHAVDVLTLDVRDGTPAHRLWKRVGFKTFGIMDDYSRYEGKSYLGHFMSIRTDDLLKQFQLAGETPLAETA